MKILVALRNVLNLNRILFRYFWSLLQLLSLIHILLWSESYVNNAAVFFQLFCFEYCSYRTLKHSLYIWCWRCLNVFLIFYYFMMWLAAFLMVCYVLNSAVFVSDVFLVSCSVGKTCIPHICFFPIYLTSFGVAHKFSHLLQVHTFFLQSPGLFRHLGMKHVTIVTYSLSYLLLWQHSTFSAICG